MARDGSGFSRCSNHLVGDSMEDKVAAVLMHETNKSDKSIVRQLAVVLRSPSVRPSAHNCQIKYILIGEQQLPS